jgi:quinoprotein glucose dehydrogenase
MIRTRLRLVAHAVVMGWICMLSACQPDSTGESDRGQQAARQSGEAWSRWASYAGSPDSAQYSSLDQINRENVSRLSVVWTYPTGATAHRSTPLVVGGVMYLVARGGVTALDATTGAELWHAPDSAAPRVRGLSWWQSGDGSDRRLLVVKDHHLHSLDADTGRPIASFGEAGRIDLRQGLGRDPESITRVASMMPGRVFENLIIVGSAVGDETYGGAPGDVRAYDVRTGELIWTFHTIPHPGEFGYETWPADAWQSAGAANAWSNLSLDEALGIVYVPTGAPSYHFYGGNRVGDNLFANSLIALDARTGERRWHFQAVHHDVWDYDIAMAPKLLTVEQEGRRIEAVALATKQGLLFLFDRRTGEPIYPIEERSVPQSDIPGEQTSPTQPFPVSLPPFARQSLSADELNPHADPAELAELANRIARARNEGLFTPPSFQGSISVPGSRGGAQHGNGAAVPQEGLLYLAVVESPTIPRLEIWQEASAEDLARMSPAEIYTGQCAVCHGPDGAGQPPLFPAVAGIAGRLSAEEFAQVVTRGQGRMAAFPQIPADRITTLMAHVDGLESVAANEVQTETAAATTTPAAALEDVRYRSGYHHFFTDVGLLGPPPWSTLVAYDLNLGRILWQKPYGDVIELAEQGILGTGSLFPANSLTATAGGLLFSATNDRRFRAWDRETGEVLWSTALPADPGGIPAVYEAGGRQYVVAAATWSRPVGNERDRNFRPGEHMVIAFSLPEEAQ